MESTGPNRATGTSRVEVRMLGPLRISRDGVASALPPSRKVRGLLAYLALSAQAVARSRLCELLWDVPNDPRGELRWCLSKIRGLLDEPGRRRVVTLDDAIGLDLGDCFVDALEIDRASREGIGTLAPDRLRTLLVLFAGDFLDGLEIDRSPAFEGWLAAQRRRLRSCNAEVLEHLAGCAPDREVLGYLEKWLELAPFDSRVHALLLDALARRGKLPEGEEHLRAAIGLFEAEGLDWAPLRDAWRAARARGQGGRHSPADARSAPPAAAGDPGAGTDAGSTVASAGPRRASVAVMPFADRSAVTGMRGGIADALAHDVITRLAKLRSLFVIAEGTVFALRERSIGAEEAGRILDVDYSVRGSVLRRGKHLSVAVELAEARTARIVWTEMFEQDAEDVFLVLDGIGDRVVASIANEIETLERNRAILRPPNSLDAWEAHHRGLWHMYRFNKADNCRARQFFEMAVRLDPTFARAHAGLSFTHFQNAFQGWADREAEIVRAFETAGQSIMADDRDPAAHWAMGRALWLRGRCDQSYGELGQAIDLSPNFALGHYTLAFVHSQAGDPEVAIASSDHSRHLSPFDPLLFGMLGSRAMALVRLGRFDEAAEWAVRAAARPNAHAHILAIAALSLALAGRLDQAQAQLAAIHRTLPRYRIDDFLAAMRLAPDGEGLFREGARRIGIG
jgi:DNA-binding SARP family transcriptional activator